MYAEVRNAMLADASVVAALGGGVHWVHAPRARTYPLAVLQKIVERRVVTLDGDDGLGRHVVQVDIYAKSHREMREAVSAIRKLWSGHRSPEIAGAFVEGVRETTERDEGAKGVLYRGSIDIKVIIKETDHEQ